MNLIPHSSRPRGRFARALTSAIMLAGTTLSVGFLSASAASADASVYTLNQNTPESWGPYWNYSSFVGSIDVDTAITISCYLTGDRVTGQYGSEDVWDEVSGAPYNQEDWGTFVPDAYIFTGSNSPVVPRCSTAPGETIGGVQVAVANGPGYNYPVVGYVSPNVTVEIKCYSTGTTVTGPYGAENIWDLTTRTYPASQQWVPDAYIYTGSNSPVVPHC